MQPSADVPTAIAVGYVQLMALMNVMGMKDLTCIRCQNLNKTVVAIIVGIGIVVLDRIG